MERKTFVRCENCLAWRFSQGVAGHCHRKSPSPAVMKGSETDKYIVVFPLTLKDDGCWEGLERDVAEEKPPETEPEDCPKDIEKSSPQSPNV